MSQTTDSDRLGWLAICTPATAGVSRRERRRPVLAAGNLHTNGRWCLPMGRWCPVLAAGNLHISGRWFSRKARWCAALGGWQSAHRTANVVGGPPKPLRCSRIWTLTRSPPRSRAPKPRASNLPLLATSSLLILCTTRRKPLRRSRRQRRAGCPGRGQRDHPAPVGPGDLHWHGSTQ